MQNYSNYSYFNASCCSVYSNEYMDSVRYVTRCSQETGRSMVEMLGVLAIMGLLTMLGLASYKAVVASHKAEDLSVEISKRAFIAATQIVSGKMPNMEDIEEYQWSAVRNGSSQFLIVVSHVNKAVCEKIIPQMEKTPLVRRVAKNMPEAGYPEMTLADCQDSNSIAFLFNNDLSINDPQGSAGTGGSGTSGGGTGGNGDEPENNNTYYSYTCTNGLIYKNGNYLGSCAGHGYAGSCESPGDEFTSDSFAFNRLCKTQEEPAETAYTYTCANGVVSKEGVVVGNCTDHGAHNNCAFPDGTFYTDNAAFAGLCEPGQVDCSCRHDGINPDTIFVNKEPQGTCHSNGYKSACQGPLDAWQGGADDVADCFAKACAGEGNYHYTCHKGIVHNPMGYSVGACANVNTGFPHICTNDSGNYSSDFSATKFLCDTDFGDRGFSCRSGTVYRKGRSLGTCESMGYRNYCTNSLGSYGPGMDVFNHLCGPHTSCTCGSNGVVYLGGNLQGTCGSHGYAPTCKNGAWNGAAYDAQDCFSRACSPGETQGTDLYTCTNGMVYKNGGTLGRCDANGYKNSCKKASDYYQSAVNAYYGLCMDYRYRCYCNNDNVYGDSIQPQHLLGTCEQGGFEHGCKNSEAKVDSVGQCYTKVCNHLEDVLQHYTCVNGGIRYNGSSVAGCGGRYGVSGVCARDSGDFVSAEEAELVLCTEASSSGVGASGNTANVLCLCTGNGSVFENTTNAGSFKGKCGSHGYVARCRVSQNWKDVTEECYPKVCGLPRYTCTNGIVHDTNGDSIGYCPNSGSTSTSAPTCAADSGEFSSNAMAVSVLCGDGNSGSSSSSGSQYVCSNGTVYRNGLTVGGCESHGRGAACQTHYGDYQSDTSAFTGLCAEGNSGSAGSVQTMGYGWVVTDCSNLYNPCGEAGLGYCDRNYKCVNPCRPHYAYEGYEGAAVKWCWCWDEACENDYDCTGVSDWTGELAYDPDSVAPSYYCATCLTGDTMVTMADGTCKRLDEIEVGDKVLCMNPDTLEQTEDVVVYTDKNAPDYDKTSDFYDYWEFSDGSIEKTCVHHRFYNVESQSFKYINEWKLGEHSINQKGEVVELIKHEVVKRIVRHYKISTEKYYNYYANNLLTGSRRTVNIKLGRIEKRG